MAKLLLAHLLQLGLRLFDLGFFLAKVACSPRNITGFGLNLHWTSSGVNRLPEWAWFFECGLRLATLAPALNRAQPPETTLALGLAHSVLLKAQRRHPAHRPARSTGLPNRRSFCTV